MTGFFELLVGVLLVQYAQAASVMPQGPQCPAVPVVPPCGGPLPDYGLYDTVGLVLVVIGLIQIAASFYVGRNRKLKPDAVANAGAIKDQTP